MDNKEFLKLIKSAAAVINNYSNRPKDKNKKPGGLIEIPKGVKPIIIGDLHGANANLNAIINHKKNLSEVKSGKAIFIIVGDALHNDQTGQMKEMQTSLDTLITLLQLIVELPDKVIYIKGNHDTFDDRLRKNGIFQGTELKTHILKTYKDACIKEIDNFFNSLPLFIIGDKYVITHAGPPRGGCSREDLINANNDLNIHTQLIWTRINEFRGNPSIKEYDENDIKTMLDRLKLPPDTHFIVGHNPLWNSGDRSGIWINVLGIKNHHIIYSNLQTRAPYLTLEKNEAKKNFAIEPAKEAFYV